MIEKLAKEDRSTFEVSFVLESNTLELVKGMLLPEIIEVKVISNQSFKTANIHYEEAYRKKTCRIVFLVTPSTNLNNYSY